MQQWTTPSRRTSGTDASWAGVSATPPGSIERSMKRAPGFHLAEHRAREDEGERLTRHHDGADDDVRVLGRTGHVERVGDDR